MAITATHSSNFASKYGPWALVTGASGGIGRSFAIELAKSGIYVILIARRIAELESIADSLRTAFGVQCKVVPADLSSNDGIAQVIDGTKDLDVGLVVCAAGFGTAGPFVHGNLSNELDMIQVNCSATTSIAWSMGNRLIERGQGGLILLSSIVAFQGVPRSAHYAATKAYVQTLAEGLRLEWKRHRVDVLSVAPGPVDTGFAARSNLTMGNAASPSVIAVQSLRSLGKQGTVRPGWLSKLLGYSLTMTPRSIRVRIMALVMGGMTRHLGS
jgi:uncharacterized protein